jgi:hypothetical protein
MKCIMGEELYNDPNVDRVPFLPFLLCGGSPCDDLSMLKSNRQG